MTPDRGTSLVVPAILAVAAPLSVVFGIVYLRNAWWTFLMYQTVFCLVAPAIESRRRGMSWREHFHLLGLQHPGKWLDLTIVLGIVSTVVTAGFLILTRERFLDPGHLTEAVESWSITPDQLIPMLVVMSVLNPVAEELFWRGYIPGRVNEAGRGQSVALTIVLPALFYASYHAVTISTLVDEALGVVLMTLGVFAGGLFWGWLRRHTGNTWGALASHGGAVLGYLAAYLSVTNLW